MFSGIKLLGVLCVLGNIFAGEALSSEFSKPWKDANTTIVLDPYYANAMNFDKIAQDPKVGAIIHKASEGSGTDSKYVERREIAKNKGYLWGSYHILTKSNPTAQIDHYLDVAGANPSETYALDIECLSTSDDCKDAALKVTVENIEKALLYFKEKTGRFPLLYTNGSVKDVLSNDFASKPALSGVKLWYARFKSNIGEFFPDPKWSTYTIWQFSSEINCTPAPGACPYRVPGTAHDIDVNIFNGDKAALKAAWPLN
jgi:GH25 family lysozyme M1 (1,4-beta-N-acetylmuramidase)